METAPARHTSPVDAMTTDDRIIHATLMLIGERGLGAMTMSQVAATAGIARQTLYNHYRDIDSIVVAAIERHQRDSIDLLDAALELAASPAGKIEQMVRHFVMVGSQAHQAFDFGSGLSAEARTMLDTYQDGVERRISAILDDGRRSGDFRRDLTPEIDTVLVRAMLNGLYELASGASDRAARIAATGSSTILAALR